MIDEKDAKIEIVIYDVREQRVVSKPYAWKDRRRARNRAERLNLEYGAHRYTTREASASPRP